MYIVHKCTLLSSINQNAFAVHLWFGFGSIRFSSHNINMIISRSTEDWKTIGISWYFTVLRAIKISNSSGSEWNIVLCISYIVFFLNVTLSWLSSSSSSLSHYAHIMWEKIRKMASVQRACICELWRLYAHYNESVQFWSVKMRAAPIAWAKSIQIKFNEHQHLQIVYLRISHTLLLYAMLPWILMDDAYIAYSINFDSSQRPKLNGINVLNSIRFVNAWIESKQCSHIHKNIIIIILSI